MSQYVVWEHHDPRKINDNFGEVYKTVSFIGSFNTAHKHYTTMKNAMKFAGTQCNYFAFPVRLRATEARKLGEKVVILAEKTIPDDDDYHDRNEEGDFFDVDHQPSW